MNDKPTMTKALGTGAMKVVYYPLADQPYFPGRRPTMKYRELGAQEASGGLMRAQVMSTAEAQTPNGWHRHLCEAQFLYILKGYIELSFEPGTSIKLYPGDSITIPGGTVHQEMGAQDAELIEISVPADMGTEGAAPPPAGAAHGIGPVVHSGVPA